MRLNEDDSLHLLDLTVNYKTYDNDFPTILSPTEVLTTIQKLKNKKAPGPDLITNEHLKLIASHILPNITSLFNKCIELGTIPSAWKFSNLTMLYKGKGDKFNPRSYRGIALSSTIFKLFCSLITKRQSLHTDHFIPQSQMGFMPGRSTIQAAQILLDYIIKSVWVEGHYVYVVFVDYKMAFDLVNRRNAFIKTTDLKCLPSDLVKLNAALLDINFITICDGISQSKKIIQSNGVLQGGPKSPKDFILITWDLEHHTLKNTKDVKLITYADDVVLFSNNLKQLQHALDNLVTWSIQERHVINVDKTKAMKFRKGGRISKNDKLYCDGTELEFVNHYDYLGVTLQPRGIAFNRHVSDRCRRAQIATYSITKLSLLSVHTALKLFNLKVAPVATYAIELIWPYLTLSDFRKIESVKSLFLKRILSVSKFTPSRLVYKLAATDYFVKEIQHKYNLPKTPSFDNFVGEREEKERAVDFEFYFTEAMSNSFWKQPNFNSRHVYTRFSVHGFHFLFCSDLAFHNSTITCTCKFCKGPCGTYHALRCKDNPFESMAHMASQSKA